MCQKIIKKNEPYKEEDFNPDNLTGRPQGLHSRFMMKTSFIKWNQNNLVLLGYMDRTRL